MKAVCKKLFSLMLVAILLVSAVPFQAFAAEGETLDPVVDETSPELYAEVVEKDTVYVEFEIEAGAGEYRIGKLVKSKIGSKVTPPSEETVLNTLKSIIGTSDGYALVRWELEDGTTFTKSTVINLSMEMEQDGYVDEETDKSYPLLHVNAIVEKVAKNISLKANGGEVGASKHKVMIGMTYGEYGKLPTPTRSGYVFQGWFKADGTLVTDETIVTDLSALTAQWAASKYTVIFQGYVDGEGWTEVGFGSFDVDRNSVLKIEYSNFPTGEQMNNLFKLEGWAINGWEFSKDGGNTWADFTAGKTKITANTIVRPLYQKNITLFANDSGNTTRKLAVTLDKRFPTLPHPGTRDGKAFLGWHLSEDCGEDSLVSTKENLSNVAKHPIVEADVTALYANWIEAKTVYLYIHTNGNTDEHTKLVKYYDVPVTGFNLAAINLADIFPNYGKYDDKGDEKFGWYDKAQWDNYCLGRHVNDTTDYVDAEYLDGDDVHEFYIMLVDNGNDTTNTGNTNGNNGYNENKNTADSTNPSTGDNIFVVMTIMAVSACAVVVLFLNKKRFAK